MVVKRSVSLPDEVVAAVEEAARVDGTSFSSWLAQAAERQLRLRAGLEGIRQFEAEDVPLSDEERAASDAVLRRMLKGMGVRGTRNRRR